MKVFKVILLFSVFLLLIPGIILAGGKKEEEAVKVELKGPTAYSAGEVRGKPAKTYPLEKIIVYKKLPRYHQPEWMDKLVAEGKLPPVEKRVPEEPFVFLTSGMSDGLGVYGGVWRDFSACPTEGWNFGAGQSQGWFGINYIIQETLVKSGPMFMRDKLEPFPNLAKSWEWSKDGYELTMNLIRGARWSDGHPFTADDVMFTWEDLIIDPNVNMYTSRTSWQIDGKDTSLEKIDDYTIKWTFPAPFPVQKFFDMDFLDFSVSPAHVLKPHHPKYNSKADYISFENCLPPQALPVVVMGPWVPVLYKTDELLILRRNPYYWKVDERGYQLPYLDEVTFEKGSSGLGRTLNTLAGSCDHSNLENPSAFIEAMKRLQEPGAHFRIEWGRETLGFSLRVNLSANFGVKDDKEAELRKLFRDLRFRRALSQAIDRDGLAYAIAQGPYLRACPGGLFPGSPYYDLSSVVYYPYSVETSKALLAEIGFKDTDGNGVLNWTGGPLEGEDLVLSCMALEDQAASVAIAEALVALFAEIGVKMNFRPVKTAVRDKRLESGEWELDVNRSGKEYAVPFCYAKDLAPVSKAAPVWRREGPQPRELLPFEKELVRIVNAFAREVDPIKRKELMKEYNKIYTENIYTVGTVIGYYGLALAKRFKNVPTGCPPFLYQWTWGNVQPDQIWVSKDEQVEQIMPGEIPIYKK